MGSVQSFETPKSWRGRPGKIDAPLNKKLSEVKWGEYRLGDLFEIQNTLSFNADQLTFGSDYDYITRTSLNQGILQETGFVNKENINEAGTWSLGLLQMDFFYRRKPWYAGQFIRKIIPKFEVTESSVLFFTTLLNKQKPKLLSVLVRDVDKTFLNVVIRIPVLDNGEIDFGFISSFIAELEAERIKELEAYLTIAGLKNYELTDEEHKALEDYNSLSFKNYSVPKLFEIKNTRNILSKDIVKNSGEYPYLCASADNNAVSTYISYDNKYMDKGNCIFIGGKTFVVTYQEKDFFSNDSHNLTLRLKDELKRCKDIQLYMATCINKSLGHRYSWGDSISNKKIKNDVISLPSLGEFIDYDSMPILISAIKKLVIRDVVLFADRKIGMAEKIVNK
ncbi:restriction endonuclease subunit S [uncultured Coprobacter sp.]|uniref:restriction endonuclease subunit S n=1 Tax=uncultured Coprobacter sp. TaxID=1720550 RepID=UPI0025F63F02|nr:restriction endonuclease subunit S [uncultured Coprobacter sp.]